MQAFQHKKIIWVMLIIVIILAILVVILYIPQQLGFSNLSCDELNNESLLVIDSANYCSGNDDCMIATDVIMHQCGCYELVNKNVDLEEIKNKRDEIDNLYNKKSCPVLLSDCIKCVIPEKNDIKCIDNKCIISK
jgi:hypothetical protein